MVPGSAEMQEEGTHGWATAVRWPTPARLDSHRRHASQSPSRREEGRPSTQRPRAVGCPPAPIGSYEVWPQDRGAAGSANRQSSTMAALETAAHPHHTEAKPKTVSRAMTMTAARFTTPKITTLP